MGPTLNPIGASPSASTTEEFASAATSRKNGDGPSEPTLKSSYHRFQASRPTVTGKSSRRQQRGQKRLRVLSGSAGDQGPTRQLASTPSHSWWQSRQATRNPTPYELPLLPPRRAV